MTKTTKVSNKSFESKYPTIAKVFPPAVLLDCKQRVRDSFSDGTLTREQASVLQSALLHFKDTIRELQIDTDNTSWFSEKLHDELLKSFRKITIVYNKLVNNFQNSTEPTKENKHD